MMMIFLAAPLAALVAYSAVRIAADRAASHQPDEERIAEEIDAYGLDAVVLTEVERANAVLQPLRDDVAELNMRLERAVDRTERLGRPLLDKHPYLVPFLVFVAVLTAIGLFSFFAERALGVGLLRTLDIGDAQAGLLGTIVAVIGALLGGGLVELMFPSYALPQIRDVSREVRLAWIAGVGVAFTGLLIVLPALATARADVRFSGQLAREQAVCAELTADPAASPSERTVACAAAAATERTLDRAKKWDALVSVAAPVGEAAGSWGLLRLCELGVAGGLGINSERARRRRDAAQAAVRQTTEDFVAVMVRAMERAGIAPDQILAAVARITNPTGAGTTDTQDPGQPGEHEAAGEPNPPAEPSDATEPPNDGGPTSTEGATAFTDSPRQTVNDDERFRGI